MARNLQSKLKPTDKVSIFDINPESMKGLETEMRAASNGATVELAASAFDASKDAVGLELYNLFCHSLCTYSGLHDDPSSICSIYDLSWASGYSCWSSS
jgi:hypothetical protein